MDCRRHPLIRSAQREKGMRRSAVAAIWGLVCAAAFPAGATEPSGTVSILPDETVVPPGDPSKLILPGQPDHPGEPAPTLPPLWLLPLPDQAARAAERDRLDAALQQRFAPVTPPARRFELDIVPLAAGQPWQVLQRGIDATLGP